MEPGPSRSSNRDWDEIEKVRLFTEIILQAGGGSSLSPSQVLYNAIREWNIVPQFDGLPLSGRRSMRECIRVFDSYGSQQMQFGMSQQGLSAGLQYHNDNRKRPFQESFLPGTRAIAPRPTSLHGDPSGSRTSMPTSAGPLTPLEGPSPTLTDSTGQRKKRGRPTKVEQQRRLEAQALQQSMARPVIASQQLPEAPFSPGHRYRHSIASPIIGFTQLMTQPSTTPHRPLTTSTTGSGGSEGRRGRGRPRKNIALLPEHEAPAPLQLSELQPSGSRRTTPPRQSKEPKASRSTRSPSYTQQPHKSPGKGHTLSYTSQGDTDEGSRRSTTGARRIWEDSHH